MQDASPLADGETIHELWRNAVRNRLELIWPNKDKVLLRLDENGKPIWGTKADLEPRLLVQLEAAGQVNADKFDDLYEQGDNLLIKGDNLLALKSLERHFAGKIKCIYIDPPFNTGNAFEHYDDGLEHTIWLSMMKARLEILKKFLRQEGVIFVHLDEIEHAYCKVILDEIFGRKNYIGTIVWRRRKSQANLASAISVIHDFVAVYSRVPLGFTFNKMVPEVWGIGEFKNPDNDPRGPWTTAPCSNRGGGIYKIKTPAGVEIEDEWRFSPETYQRLLKEGRIVFPKGGKGKPRYKIYKHERKGVIPSSWWDDCGSTQEAKEEMKILFGDRYTFDTPKPERLMKRIIEVSTNKGDWVLDSFLGSGTTAAVAHKLERNWIGIECLEHAETLCLPRMKKVQKGDDGIEVSKQVGWKGGGGFRYCVLGESLFAKDEDTGLVMINPKYTNGPLVAAVSNIEDFRLNNDSVFHGVRGNMLAHVTEHKVTQGYLDALVDGLPLGKSLVVYCLKRAAALNVPENVRIKRIPKELQIPRYLTATNEERVKP